MRIGIDIMGGDFAPEATVLGVLKALDHLSPDEEAVMIGNKEVIVPILVNQGKDPKHYQIVHASETIEMGDNPSKAFFKKRNSSINIGFDLLNSKEIDGFASAGNSGAMLVGSMTIIKSIHGILRPCVTAGIPKENGKFSVLLDIGINSDCKPEVLYQYGILGSIYVKYIHGIENPRVALLNIGSEEKKGNLITQMTYDLMKDSSDFHFIGNIEGNELFTGDKADVIVCDGFTGNIVLKLSESFYTLIKKRNINDPYFDKFNYESYGGTPILGVNSNIVLGHGMSNATTIQNMILHTREVIQNKIVEKIQETLS